MIKPEITFLINSVCFDDKPTNQHFFNQLNTSYLLSVARQHNLSVPLLHYLKKHDLSPPTQNKLEKVALKQLAFNAQLWNRFAKIVNAFNAQGIKFCALKGFDLMATVYSSITIRQVSDIDLLVPPQHISKAVAILKQMGFNEIHEKIKYNKKLSYSLGNHYPMLKKGFESVELHFRLFYAGLPKEQFSGDYFCNNASIVTFGGVIYPVLSPNQAFLFGLNHLYRHIISGDFQLRWLVDLVLYYRKFSSAIDLKHIKTIALQGKQLHKAFSISLGLVYLVDSKQNTAIKAYVGDNLPEAQKTLNQILKGQPLKKKPFKVFFNKLSAIRSINLKVIFVLNELFPSPNYLLATQKIKNKRQLPFYYFKRFLSLTIGFVSS